jgi:hypothetical protein
MRDSLGHNPLSVMPCRNSGMVLNGQWSGRLSLGDAPCRGLGTILSEQGPGRHFLSGALHRRPSVVKSEQGSSHLSQWVRRVRKLLEQTRFHASSWNVGSLTSKLRELVDVAFRSRVNIPCVQETKWKGKRWRILASSFGTRGQLRAGMVSVS